MKAILAKKLIWDYHKILESEFCIKRRFNSLIKEG